MKKKLIRDNVPELAKATGDELETQVLDEADFKKELAKKLVEEAEEIVSAETSEKLMEEMADVLEVLMSLAEAHQARFQDIDQCREEKRKKSGGFTKRLLLVGKNGQEFWAS